MGRSAVGAAVGVAEAEITDIDSEELLVGLCPQNLQEFWPSNPR
jgi:hypothetical protein